MDASAIGLPKICFLNLSLTLADVLNSAGLVVNSSLDYDLNLGFETLAFTNIIILSLIWFDLMSFSEPFYYALTFF